ncbi:hypothetical protein SteCoe_30086 [Stentor coeruleus]|uniref:Uncharacterized protein n=1 Tax=Stentor coeruleus TaxID=5963 RepID=A0A1R2B4H4_9CILI|nr:hypothetical protein SteCoe_30086 [Stentor coeruleus]
MSESIIFYLDDLATSFENTILSGYMLIKSKPPCHIILIYIVLYFLLTRFIRSIKRSNIKVNYKIIDEQSEDSIAKVIKTSTKDMISALENIENNKETENKLEYTKKFEKTIKEISMVQDMYSEFQDEIIDSHQSIISSIRLPVMK